LLKYFLIKAAIYILICALFIIFLKPRQGFKAKQNFYEGIAFHRVVPGFVIQAGDPTATGWGGPGYDIVSEYSDTDFGIGYVGMASAGKDTESSQFFIMQGSHPHLDSRYTLFAKVIEGMDVVYNITEEDLIISIELK